MPDATQDPSVARWRRVTLIVGFCCGTCALSACFMDFNKGPDPRCGDGVVEPGEACDGADFGGQTCLSALGLPNGTLGCTAACQLILAGCHRCGDGVIEEAEECDDDNDFPGDGCSEVCALEEGWTCANEPTECMSTCGDGVAVGTEECDDGDTQPGDGCSATCRIEQCGNGVLDPWEECDDGNSDNTDACLTNCAQASCGDAHIHAGVEVCEAGDVPSTCEDVGFSGGTLGCAPDCLSFDTSGCTGGAVDGASCDDDTDCDGSICLTETGDGFPDGQCTRDCNNSSCSPGATCLQIGNNQHRCYAQCLTSADCRPGYYCRVDPWTFLELICRPLCTVDTDCPHTGSCDPYTGLCVVGDPPVLDPNGAACTGSNSCSGSCWTVPTGGYCVSPCNLSSPACPGDGVCSDINSTVGDGGYCLDGCTDNSDCRAGYFCQNNPYGSGDICID